MKQFYFLISLMMILVLGACSSTEPSAADASGNTQTGLSTNYENALSVQGQLALGTVRLEDPDVAVDETQAIELLPLWRALQSLSNSDTAASAELDAVVNQIANTMTEAQIQAIADMALTSDSMTELMQSGELGFGPGGGGQPANNGDNDNAAGFPAGGFPAGGPPGGGFAAGGSPGEGVPGAFPGGDTGAVSEDDIATRQAAFANGDAGGFQEMALTGMVIRLLAEKSGEEMPNPGSNVANTVFTAVSETTGINVEDIQAQISQGETLAEIIEASGADVEDVKTAVLAALQTLPEAETMDVEQMANSWLGIEP